MIAVTKREKKRRESVKIRGYIRNFSLPLFVPLSLSLFLFSHFRETSSRFWLFSLIEKSANCFSPICTCFNVEHCLEYEKKVTVTERFLITMMILIKGDPVFFFGNLLLVRKFVHINLMKRSVQMYIAHV